MSLHIPTATILAAVVFATQSTALIFQFLLNRSYRGPGWWLAGTVVKAVGFLLMTVSDERFLWIVSILANPLVVLGQVFLNLGIRRFLGLKRSRSVAVALYGIFLAAYVCFLYIDTGVTGRSIVVLVSSAGISAATALALYFRGGRPFRHSAFYTAAVFLAHALAQTAAAVSLLFMSPLESYRELQGGTIRGFFLLTPIVAGILWTIGFLLMFNQRLNGENIEERNRMEMVFNISPDAEVIVRLGDGIVVDVNQAFLDVTGYSFDEIVGKPVEKLGFWTSLENRKEYIAELERNGLVRHMEASFLRKDGTLFTGQISGRRLLIGGQPHVVTVVRDVTERKEAERKVRELLAEKELILKEVHHRIKNNMSTIHGLLSLQAAAVRDAEAASALKDAGSRIQSMMVIYEKLYRSGGVQDLSAADYLPALIDELASNFPNVHTLSIEKRIEDFTLKARTLQPLGILINELLTNTLKYAFDGRDGGRILVSASLRGDTVTIVVEDDGKGMPEGIDFDTSTGFGLQLVQGLTMQLKGRIRIERIAGTRVVLEFPR